MGTQEGPKIGLIFVQLPIEIGNQYVSRIGPIYDLASKLATHIGPILALYHGH